MVTNTQFPVFMTCCLCFVCAANSYAEEPIQIGSNLELLVDNHLIERIEGDVCEQLHSPIPREVVIVHDLPWEGCGCGYHTVFKDGDKYRMYYKAWQITAVAPRQTEDSRLFICYAESDDGIHWTKPNLGLHEYDGSKQNNIVIADVNGGLPHDFSVFKDSNPNASPDAKYKAVGYGFAGNALYAFKSADGIHWTAYNNEKPVMSGHRFDTQNTAFWDPNIGKYRAYVRDFSAATSASPRLRGIMTATSDDFLNWSDAQWLDYGDAPKEQLYTNQIKPYYRAPQIYIGFPSRYVERAVGESNRQLPGWDERQQRAAASKRYGTAVTDSLLITSRDGLHFKRWGETFLRPGLRANNWAYGDNYIAWHVVETVSDAPGNPPELSLYATEDYFTGHDVKLRRYSLRLDGFVSLHSPISGGSLVTKPIVFDGDSLKINYATSAAGSIRIELQDADGDPVPGYSSEECDEIYGDQLDRTVTWQGKGDVGELAGKPVRMVVQLKDADLYSFQFKNQIESVLRLTPGQGNLRNSEGDFIRLNDGRLLFIYTHFYGGGGDHSPARLAARYSDDGGKSWNSDDRIIVENEGDMNVMSVSLLRLHDGRIALFYLQKNSVSDNRPVMRISSDEAKTWSAPIEIIPKEQNGYYVLNNDRVIQTSSGRLIAPVAQHCGYGMGEPDKWTGNGLLSCYLSDDAGKSWRRSKESFHLNDVTGNPAAAQEPGVVELNDGRILMYIRTLKGTQHFAWSSDCGETWTDPVPSGLRSPLSPASIERIPQTGDLMAVWNDNYDPTHGGGGNRSPLSAAVSSDDGKSWSKPVTLFDDPDGWYCYTAIHLERDHVLLGHCAGGSGQGGVGLSVSQITRFPISALYEERLKH